MTTQCDHEFIRVAEQLADAARPIARRYFRARPITWKSLLKWVFFGCKNSETRQSNAICVKSKIRRNQYKCVRE